MRLHSAVLVSILAAVLTCLAEKYISGELQKPAPDAPKPEVKKNA